MKKRTSLLLLLIVIAKVVYQIILLRDGFVSVSGDDFLRALIAHEWAKEPFFASAAFGEASVLWMPLHFWVVGVALKVYPCLWLAPALMSLCFSVLTLGLLYWIAQHLWGSRAGLITALLAGFMPWEIWLSMSGISDTLYQFTVLSGIAFVVKWEGSKRKHSTSLFMSATSFLFATMVRPEGWLFSVAFSAYLAWGWIVALRSGELKWQPILATMIPWFFVAYWLFFNYLIYGDPIHFIRLSRVSYLDEAAGLDSLALRILKDPLMMLMVSPLIFPLGALALLTKLKEFMRNPLIRTYIFFVLAGLMLLTLAGVAGTGTRSTPQRYVVLNVLLLIPFAASWLDAWSRWPRKRACAWGGIAAVLCLNLIGGFRYSEAFSDTVAVGRFLQSKWESGTLKPEDRICTERELLAYAGAPITNPLERRMAMVTDWCLRVISNHPDQFGLTIADDFNQEEGFHRKKVSDAFRQGAIRWILVRSEKGVRQVPTNYTFAGSVAGFSLFSDGKAAAALSGATKQRISSPMSAPLSPDVTLIGYSMDRSSLPKYVSLYWSATRKTMVDYETRVQYVGGANQDAALDVKHAQQHGAYPSSRWAVDEIIEQRIDFPQSSELGPGEYVLKISLEDTCLSSAADEGASRKNGSVDIGPVWIILSKRTALRSFLVESPRSFRLLAKVLWYL